jgi:hypothetical protein
MGGFVQRAAMATIHVARDGTKLGEFSLEEIREGLRSGQFRRTDLGWQSGMPDWLPLSEFAVEKSSAATRSSEAAVASTAEVGLPWEHRHELGFFKAYFETVSLLLMKPSAAFTMMRREGGTTEPLLFALIGTCLGTIASFLFPLAFQSIPGMGAQKNPLEVFGAGPVIGFLVLTPLLMGSAMFVGGGILHLCLRFLGGAKRPFETTFRVFCFSCGAAYLFSIIPFCGGYVTVIYNIVLQSIGVARTHETTTGKAVLAVFLLPLIICCGVVAVLMVFLLVVGSSGGDLMKSLRP